MEAVKKLDKLLERFQNWVLIITGTAVGSMIIINAACRMVRIDWFGSEELTLFVAFWLYFVGAACAARDDTHISADMLSLFTHNVKIRASAKTLKNLIGLCMCGVFTYWCFNYVGWQWALGAKSPRYKLPVVISTIPILICFALWTLYLVRDLIRSIHEFKRGEE